MPAHVSPESMRNKETILCDIAQNCAALPGWKKTMYPWKKKKNIVRETYICRYMYSIFVCLRARCQRPAFLYFFYFKIHSLKCLSPHLALVLCAAQWAYHTRALFCCHGCQHFFFGLVIISPLSRHHTDVASQVTRVNKRTRTSRLNCNFYISVDTPVSCEVWDDTAKKDFLGSKIEKCKKEDWKFRFYANIN